MSTIVQSCVFTLTPSPSGPLKESLRDEKLRFRITILALTLSMAGSSKSNNGENTTHAWHYSNEADWNQGFQTLLIVLAFGSSAFVIIA